MNKLCCEICNGTNLVKTDTIFVCQDCGAQYSVEAIRSMLQGGTSPASPSSPAAPVNTANLLELAKRALDANNNAEAESYCNRILETDPNHCEALMTKGKAAGWQSTVQNNRFSEAVSCFAAAVKAAPEEEKSKYIDDASTAVFKLCLALVSVQCDNVKKWANLTALTGLTSCMTAVLKTLTQFATDIGKTAADDQDLLSAVAALVCVTIEGIWKSRVYDDYYFSNNGHPSDNVLKNFMDTTDACIGLVELSIDLCKHNDENDIESYEFLISMQEAVINSHSYEYSTYVHDYIVNLTPTEANKAYRNGKITEYTDKISSIKADIVRKAEEEEQKRKEAELKRIEEYWAANPDEKAALEAEKAELQAKVRTLMDSRAEVIAKYQAERKELETSAEFTELSGLDKEAAALTQENATLGAFKGKRKKEISERLAQIPMRKTQLSAIIRGKINDINTREAAEKGEFDREIGSVNARLGAISKRFKLQ